MFAQQDYRVAHRQHPSHSPTGTMASAAGLLNFRLWVAVVWAAVQCWLLTHALVPPWLPRRCRHPVIGYLVAVVLQVLFTGGDLVLLRRYPDLSIHHLPLVLGVVVVALYWGVGPSLVATFTGTLLLYSVVLFTPLSWSLATETDLAEFVLFLLSCGTISVLASQTQRARLHAEQARRAAEHLAASLAQEHARSTLERQRLHAVLEVLPVGVCLVSATGQVLTRNQAERAIWGSRLSEEPGPSGTAYQGWWAQTGQPIRPDEWAVARAVTQGKETSGDEVIIPTEDGRHRTFLNAAVPIRDETGAIVGAVSALLDIFERKQLEDTLRQAEREHLVREREAAEAQALVWREANRQRDAFLAIASHELKTPLSSLLLGLQLLQRRTQRTVAPAAEEATPRVVTSPGELELILQQLGRLTRLVNDQGVEP